MKPLDQYHVLVKDNHNLIYGFLYLYNLEVDDNYDLAAIGLCKAAQSYDPDHGVSFGTYAYKCMKREFQHEHEKVTTNKRKHETDLSLETLQRERDDSFLPENYQKDEIRKLQSQIFVQEFIASLKEQEADIVSMRLQGFTLKEIGEKYHISRQRIEQRVAQIRDKYTKFTTLRKAG